MPAAIRGSEDVRVAFRPAKPPSQPVNTSQTDPLLAIIARTDPNEQESVVVLPDPL